MNKTVLQKMTSVLLAALFAVCAFAAPVSAKHHKDNHKPPGHSQRIKHNKDRGDIVIEVLGCSGHDFWRARRAGMTLEDLIIAMYIAHEIKDHDFEDIFHMKKNGKPYKEICKAYGINWGSVRRHMNKRYDIMSEDAVKIGLIMWGLHEILD